jgi:phosphoglycolate phosphatase
VRHVLRADLLIFDLDGTLIDSTGDIAWAVARTLESMGHDGADLETVKSSIGWGVRSLLENLMPGADPRKIDTAREVFLEQYGGHLMVETSLYEGVPETLEYLKGKKKKMAIVTNKPIGLTQRIFEDFGMKGFFDIVLGGDSLPHKKPNPEPVLKVMDELRVGPEKTVFVGDSAIDCETGRRAGIVTIGAAYGFRGTRELVEAGCEIIVEKISELKEIII